MPIKETVTITSLALSFGAFRAEAYEYDAVVSPGETLATATIISIFNVTATGSASSLDEINGHFTSPSGSGPLDEAEVFGLYLALGETLTAVVKPGLSGPSVSNTTLSLYDQSGNGLVYNDDISHTNKLSEVSFVPTYSGLYYLAISTFDYLPIYGRRFGAPEFIFRDTSFPTYDPTLQYNATPGSLPLLGWSDGYAGPLGDDGNYQISLSGAAAVPEPAWGLGTMIFIATFNQRRRQGGA
jgi:hypothetical protein